MNASPLRHYTWGALLDLAGIESICDAEAGGMVLLTVRNRVVIAKLR